MNNHSPALQSLLNDLRQHPAFPELLKAIPQPQIPVFRPSQAEQVETARAKWIHASGQRNQHRQWLLVLTGEVPSEDE